MEAIKNDHELNDYIDFLAKCAFEEYDMRGEHASDVAHEIVDGSEHLIYPYKAHAICLNCNVDYGNEFVRDIGFELDWNQDPYDQLAISIVYGEMTQRLIDAIEIEIEKRGAAA